MANRNTLCDMGYENAVIFENPDYDSAIIGISTDERVIYRYSLMIEYLVEREGMSVDDAIDFVDYNTIRSLPYVEKSPIVMYDLI